MAKVRVDVSKDSPFGSSWLERLELAPGEGVVVIWNAENDQFTVRTIAADDAGIAGLTPSSIRTAGVGE